MLIAVGRSDVFFFYGGRSEKEQTSGKIKSPSLKPRIISAEDNRTYAFGQLQKGLSSPVIVMPPEI